MQGQSANGLTQIIKLGSGDTIISDVYMNDGSVGVTFANMNTEVGKHHSELDGRAAPDLDDYLMILSENPKSLQVLIDKLTLAHDHLTSR